MDPNGDLPYLPPAAEKRPEPDAQPVGYPNAEEKIKTYTPEQQKELLLSYIKVPREYWSMLKSGDRVQYYDIDGKFHTGGYIDRVLLEYVPHGKTQSHAHIKLVMEHSVSSKKPYSWNVRYDRIRDIYMRPDVATFIMQKEMAKAMDVMQRNLEKLAQLVNPK